MRATGGFATSLWAIRVAILAIAGCLAAGQVGRAAERAATPTDKEVTIEGKAAGSDANAMEQAKQDALRRAVEQTCGTFISTQTKVKNYAAVHDKILSYAQGFVAEYEVVSRRVEGGVSHCKVRAKVSTAAFEQEWGRLVHTLEEEGNPRCVIVIVEDNDTDDTKPPKADGVSQGVLENFFIDKGVQLMDREASEKVRERDLALAAINDDVNKLASIAAAFKADIVIRGAAEARRAGEIEVAGRKVFQWTATINIKAYQTDSARMLMSNSYTVRTTTTGATSGGDDSIRKCAEENAPKILRDIGEAWRKRQNIRRICQVVLENCARKDYKTFEEAMLKVEGVQGVKMRELVNNVCHAEVDWAYDLERLVGRIEALKVDGATYDIVEQTGDRVTVKIVK